MSQAEANGGQEREFPPAINGTEQRLDAILAELRTLNRAQMQPESAATDPSIVQLREPVKGSRKR